MKMTSLLAVILSLTTMSCSRTATPPADFLKAELHGYMEKVGYKDLHLTVQQLVEYSSEPDTRQWTKLSESDWSMTMDVSDGNKLALSFSAVPELKGGVLLKSVKGKDVNLEGFGVMTFTAMLQAKQKEVKH